MYEGGNKIWGGELTKSHKDIQVLMRDDLEKKFILNICVSCGLKLKVHPFLVSKTYIFIYVKTSTESGKKLRIRTLVLNFFLHN